MPSKLEIKVDETRRSIDAVYKKLEKVIDAIADLSDRVSKPAVPISMAAEIKSMVEVMVSGVEAAIVNIPAPVVKVPALSKPDKMRGTNDAITSLEPLYERMDDDTGRAHDQVLAVHRVVVGVDKCLIGIEKKINRLKIPVDKSGDVIKAVDSVRDEIYKLLKVREIDNGMITELEAIRTAVGEIKLPKPISVIDRTDEVLDAAAGIRKALVGLGSIISDHHSNIAKDIKGIKIPKPQKFPEAPPVDMSSVEKLREHFVDYYNLMTEHHSNTIKAIKAIKIPKPADPIIPDNTDVIEVRKRIKLLEELFTAHHNDICKLIAKIKIPTFPKFPDFPEPVNVNLSGLATKNSVDKLLANVDELINLCRPPLIAVHPADTSIDDSLLKETPDIDTISIDDFKMPNIAQGESYTQYIRVYQKSPTSLHISDGGIHDLQTTVYDDVMCLTISPTRTAKLKAKRYEYELWVSDTLVKSGEFNILLSSKGNK